MRNPRRRAIVMGAALAAGSILGIGAFAQQPRVIAVVARKFLFIPSEIQLKKGEAVTLELTSPDVVMGFNAPDFKARTVIVPGQVARVTFTPDKVGTFTFLCDVFCGDGHEAMHGTLVVT